jgi:hypothetical protein
MTHYLRYVIPSNQLRLQTHDPKTMNPIRLKNGNQRHPQKILLHLNYHHHLWRQWLRPK